MGETNHQEIKSQIPGVFLKELAQISDQRGAVLHMLRNDADDFEKFGECYFSEVLPGKIKAWKFHKEQTQNLAVPVGRVRFVLFDNRDPNNEKLEIIELGRPDAYSRLKIPPQIWYGFSCISEETALITNCANIPHSPEESLVKDVNDPFVPYKWDQ
jgi:dTDP-4-dehydrorhamnose 3,5-epimerase